MSFSPNIHGPPIHLVTIITDQVRAKKRHVINMVKGQVGGELMSGLVMYYCNEQWITMNAFHRS